MRILDVIADSLKKGQAHPTTVMNALIEADNQGGKNALRDLEEHLLRSARALKDRQHPHAELAHAWLHATRMYLINFYVLETETPAAIPVRKRTLFPLPRKLVI